MKWPAALLIMFVLVLTVTAIVFFKDKVFSPEVTLSESEKKGMKLLKIAQDACLSGQTDNVDLYAKVQGSLTEGANAGAGISDVTSKGAVNYLDESIRNIADGEIRACLDPHLRSIKACILGDCQADELPKTIDFKFKNSDSEQINTQNQYSDIAFFRLQNKQGEKKLVKQDDDFFSETIELLDIGVTSIAQVAFQVRQGNTLLKQPAKICLQRAKTVKPNDNNYVEFRCNANGECLHDEMSPKWFDLCPLTNDPDSSISNLNWLSPFISEAYAQTKHTYWAVPSLPTLESRVDQQDLIGIGYTHFFLSSDKPIRNGADALYYDLQVNGQTVLEDGLYPDFNLKSYDDTQPLSINFGLQNLNFSGQVNGCDELTLNIQFLKDGQPIGDNILWHRSYVSLRDAREKQLKVGATNLSWQGIYRRASKEYDSEVFVNSVFVNKTLQFAENIDAIKDTQQVMSKMKAKFDQAGLTFQGQTLVAVIRPPLTQISYGLAVGIVEETGQIRYTFSSTMASELKSYLLALREQGQKYRNIIRKDSFIYTLRSAKSYSQSPAICWDELTV